MSDILSTGFENALTGGAGFVGQTNAAYITRDATLARHGSYSMKIAAPGGVAVYESITISTYAVTGSFYFYVPSLPAASVQLLWLTIGAKNARIALTSAGKLQLGVGTSNGTLTTTTLTGGAWYLIDYKVDASGTTWTGDFRVSDTDGTLIEAGVQTTLASQVATLITTLRHGQVLTNAATIYFDDARATDQAADYPLGAGVGSDGLYPPVTSFPPSWLDDPTLIPSGVVYGMGGSANLTNIGATIGPTKGNRPNYIVEQFVTDALAVPSLSLSSVAQTGALFGYQQWPMIHPFGFGHDTSNWPASGLAAFTNGSMDSTLSAWATAMNTKLGSTPFFVRVFREMNNTLTLYGANGAAFGGVNETPTSFIAAWRYVISYWRARVPMARFVWCVGGGAGTPATMNDWHPGDAYVDWNAVDVYARPNNSFDVSSTLGDWYTAFRPGGTFGYTKPVMIAEMGVSSAAPDRGAALVALANLIASMPDLKAAYFWDAPNNTSDPFFIGDTPSGFLATYQTVVSSFPFLGTRRPRSHRRRRSTQTRVPR